jgi:hypothetical protein
LVSFLTAPEWTSTNDSEEQMNFMMPLPLTGETAQQVEAWIDAVVDGEQTVTLIWDEKGLVGGGYEFERPMSAEVDGKPVTWTERVQVVRSLALAERESQQLEQRLAKAEAALRALTPPPGRGRRPYRDEAALQTAVSHVLERYGVTGLLQVTWQREEETVTRYVGRGRGSPKRSVRTEVRVRYVIAEVRRDEEAIQRRKHRLGWRIQVTNLAVPPDVSGPGGCSLPEWVVSGKRFSSGEGSSNRHQPVVCTAG